MQQSTKDQFVHVALDKLRDHLAKQGIIVRNDDSLKDTVIDIGETYYQMKRKEDLV